MSVITWSEVKEAAKQIFCDSIDYSQGIDESERVRIGWRAVEWIREAWEKLSLAGLASYRNDTERCTVLVTFLALVVFYIESCGFAWRWEIEDNYLVWAKYLEIRSFGFREIISHSSDINLDENEDEDRLYLSKLRNLIDNANQELSAIMTILYSNSILFKSIRQSIEEDVEEVSEDEYDYFERTETEALCDSWWVENIVDDYEQFELHQAAIAACRIVHWFNNEELIPDIQEEIEHDTDLDFYWKTEEILNDLILTLNIYDVSINQYIEPSFPKIYHYVKAKGLNISERTLRRYHLALKPRKFVILSGISGTGKSWLTEAYADAVKARHLLVPVAPNWTTNEDLLGYLNPLDKEYHYTDFSRFLEEASQEYKQAKYYEFTPRPYHLVLDEMNLARVEYYLAKFLSVMEVRMRGEEAEIELAPNKKVLLPPNLYVIGTVNVDETTHGFADKVYDRAQLIELEVSREDLYEHLGEVEYREVLMQIWDKVHTVAPFAFRVLDEIKTYVNEAKTLDVSWQHALDEQLLQKILPKIKGTDERVGEALKAFVEIAEYHEFLLSPKKAIKMLETFENHGFTSYF